MDVWERSLPHTELLDVDGRVEARDAPRRVGSGISSRATDAAMEGVALRYDEDAAVRVAVAASGIAAPSRGCCLDGGGVRLLTMPVAIVDMSFGVMVFPPNSNWRTVFAMASSSEADIPTVGWSSITCRTIS